MRLRSKKSIHKKQEETILGIQQDKELTWDCHLDSICCKLSSGIYVLLQLSKYFLVQIMITDNNVPLPDIRIDIVKLLHKFTLL